MVLMNDIFFFLQSTTLRVVHLNDEVFKLFQQKVGNRNEVTQERKYDFDSIFAMSFFHCASR